MRKLATWKSVCKSHKESRFSRIALEKLLEVRHPATPVRGGNRSTRPLSLGTMESPPSPDFQRSEVPVSPALKSI
ncbi:MAG: hypothetical protein KF851_15205 [Pirellulaceae bacterium]|nr:hypothetical protein [Pirellulaceae bacterium]